MPYDWSRFELSMYYSHPREELSRRWATAGGLQSFFIETAEHTSRDGRVRETAAFVASGDLYRWQYLHDFVGEGRFLDFEQDRRVSFSFGAMKVDVSFRDVESGTEVHLQQSNCATEDPDRAWQHLNCRSCWIYFMTNLRSVLQTGADLRDHDHPQWNDSVSIGWDRSTAPGA